ncbi:DUF4292 domain-containing protein [Zeaxanthinibacter enoshimensis]|uniref:DUF4292 domain-containing protein n=1 Tax=Zeaxanthinibacter enoshimensis TaxID=392009 RepID=UPI0035670CA0
MKGLTLYTTRFLMAIMCLGVFYSCSSSRVALDGTVNSKLSAKAVIKNHYKNQPDFKTLSGRMRITYQDGDATQSVNVSLRMEKDKVIWISAPLGVVKAYITPNKVSFYNKLENEYFDGDYSYFSDLLGTTLDFEKIQNLLLGQALYDLTEDKYELSPTPGSYLLRPGTDRGTLKTEYSMEPKFFMLAFQQIAQPMEGRLLQVSYKNYQEVSKRMLPEEVGITVIEKDRQNNIQLEYKSLEINRSLNFPFKIPNGFNEIVLK